MNRRMYRFWCSQAFIEASRIGGRHFVLLGVERIAQCELNMSLGTGERQTLCIVRRNQKRDHRGVLRFAGRGALQGVAGSKHRDILQDSRGLLVAPTARSARKQNVHAGSRSDKSGNGNNFIDANGNGAHARRNQRWQSGAGVLASQAIGQDKFAARDRDDNAMTYDFRFLSRRGRREVAGGNPDDLDVVLFDSRADLKIIGSHHDFHASFRRPAALRLQALVDINACQEADGKRQNSDHQQTCPIHSVSLAQYCRSTWAPPVLGSILVPITG